MPGAFDLGEMHNLLPALHRRKDLNSPPDEVLSHIFGYLIQPSHEVMHLGLAIASVMRHRREVAFRTPFLWTTIRINHDRQMSVLEEILLRSQHLPLDIYIRLEAFRYRFFPEYTQAIDALIPNLARWRLLSVTATNPVLHTIRNRRVRSLPLTALEQLELVSQEKPPTRPRIWNLDNWKLMSRISRARASSVQQLQLIGPGEYLWHASLTFRPGYPYACVLGEPTQKAATRPRNVVPRCMVSVR
ncbi:hypothetical protein DFH06DRAFT_1437200 [Mycena polygramma]|nr:hypothetical protein DFH06DRAFT_1437200 [Mycena polygramma]